MGVDLKKVLDILAPTEEVVSFSEFVLSPDFCGARGIYDFWLNEGDKLNDPEELIIDGSLGGGKTVFASYYTAYRLYKLFSIPDLRKHLGIMDDTILYILYFNVSLTTAKRSGFSVLTNVIDGCAWFTKYFPRDKNLTSSLRFPNGVQIDIASKESHQISLDVIGFILDEGNFRKGVGLGVAEEYAEVTQLYSQLLDRQISRFVTPEGSRAFSILISSASYQSSFVEQRKKVVANSSRAAVITAVTYLIKPENYSKETFDVFIGTGTISPTIVKDEEHKKSIIRKLGFEGLGDMAESYFRSVPVSIRSAFETNCPLALQNHCGVPTQVQGRLFSNMEIVRNVLYTPDRTWFPDIVFTLSNQDDFQLMDVLDVNAIEYPERPHSFFLDLSYAGNPGGFSCYRNDSILGGKTFHTHIFTLSIQPPPFPGETRISKFQTFLEDLSQFVNIAEFATDNFQSKQLRQEVQEALLLPDTRLSLDSSDEFFLHWMRGMVDGSCNVLNIPMLLKELENLIHNLKTHRVVKAQGMDDDISQSVCGAYFLSSVYTSPDATKELTELRRNVVGKNTIRRMTRYLGYS